ncbi:MAG: hypothetical protein E7005_08060 [Alphaproteobacteria bacterium]|nr:hypothetical protein [Alphaproteobacteria bacterium]
MSEDILEKQLIEIIRNKDLSEDIKVAKIDMLIRLGADVNALYGAKSLLKLANEVNEPKIAKMLEDNKAEDFIDKEKANKLGLELCEICQRVFNINIAKVKELMDMGADVNAKDYTGHSALIFVSKYGVKEVVELLIQNGVDVNLKDKYNNTALMWAANYGFKEVVELLILSGADVNLKDTGGRNVIMHAENEEIRKAIIDAVKKRNEKTGENVVIQGFERE